MRTYMNDTNREHKHRKEKIIKFWFMNVKMNRVNVYFSLSNVSELAPLRMVSGRRHGCGGLSRPLRLHLGYDDSENHVQVAGSPGVCQRRRLSQSGTDRPLGRQRQANLPRGIRGLKTNTQAQLKNDSVCVALTREMGGL